MAGCRAAVVITDVTAALFVVVAGAQVLWSLLSAVPLPMLKVAIAVVHAVSVSVLVPGGLVRSAVGDTMTVQELLW